MNNFFIVVIIKINVIISCYIQYANLRRKTVDGAVRELLFRIDEICIFTVSAEHGGGGCRKLPQHLGQEEEN